MQTKVSTKGQVVLQGRCAADLIFGQVILWTRLSMMVELC